MPLRIIIILILFFQNCKAFSNNFNLDLINSAQFSALYKGSDAIVIYDSTVVDVKESGLSYVTTHKLILIVSEVGARNHRSIHFGYDPLSADIKILFARIYRNHGEPKIIDTSKVLDYPAPARMIYWGGREKAIEFGRLEPGDAIEYIALRKGFTYALLQDDDERFAPPMRGHFYDIVEFWSALPVIEKVYKVAMPKDKPLQYEIYNGELNSYIHFAQTSQKDISVVVNPQSRQFSEIETNAKNQQELYADLNAPIRSEDIMNQEHQAKTIYCWSKRDISPFKGEANMVAVSDAATKLLVSTSADWYAKSVWFHSVNENYGSFDVSSEVKILVDSLLKGVVNEIDKISILTHWAAEEIRYSGISMGEGEGYTLHKGEMTFADRCGVCKDKAGMLVTMLRATGFESYPAMTMAGSRIDRIPADQFNHSVTVAKLSDGKWILLDPTWVPGVRELWSSAEQQQEFLLGIPGGTDLMTTPISAPENHYLRLKGESKLLSDGTLEGELTLTAEGQSDGMLRRAFTRNFRSAWEDYFARSLSAIKPGCEIVSLNYTNPYNISEPFKAKIKYIIPNYARVAGNKYIFTPVTAANPFKDEIVSGELYVDTSLTGRKYDFRIRCSKLFEVEETIKLPTDKAIYIPQFADVSGNSSEFTAKYTISGNTLKLQSRHSMNKRIYEASEWQQFKSALKERLRMMSEKVILIKN